MSTWCMTNVMDAHVGHKVGNKQYCPCVGLSHEVGKQFVNGLV